MIQVKKLYRATFISTFAFFMMGVLGAVVAYFTVSAISSHNTFETGSLKVYLTDANETQSINVLDSWTGTNLLPGSSVPEKKIEVFNGSSINADHVDLKFTYTGDENIAKNFIFGSSNNGFRYGSSSDGSSVNLITALKGGTDVDYIVTQGSNGLPFTPNTVDGIDGSIKDGKISLHELSLFGKIRIQKGEERGGIDAGTAADVWLNAEMGEGLTSQGGAIDMTITATLDQHATQF